MNPLSSRLYFQDFTTFELRLGLIYRKIFGGANSAGAVAKWFFAFTKFDVTIHCSPRKPLLEASSRTSVQKRYQHENHSPHYNKSSFNRSNLLHRWPVGTWELAFDTWARGLGYPCAIAAIPRPAFGFRLNFRFFEEDRVSVQSMTRSHRNNRWLVAFDCLALTKNPE